MPTYDYKCLECDHRFERFQSITADPLRECPECSGSVKRLIGTGAAVIFKGSGFYETDYRSKSYQEAKKAEEKSASSSSEEGSDASSTSSSDTSSSSPSEGSSSKGTAKETSSTSDGD